MARSHTPGLRERLRRIMIFLKVSYRVRAHQVDEFERIFAATVLPVAREHRLTLLGIWKTLVGPVGEYLELWVFESVQDFEDRWPAFLRDPRLQEAFKTTGPMVEEENFMLLTRALEDSSRIPDSSRFSV